MEALMTFRLARMCPFLRRLTLAVTVLPLAFAIAAGFGVPLLWAPALSLVLIYVWVWTRFRPTAFVIHPHALEIIWPLKRREIRRDQISAARLIDGEELRRQVGWGMRVGAGGLWGGFGWLWTSRRGIVQMYVSRLDRFVWIERGSERPWLITPEQPELFVDNLGASKPNAA
jgi:Bacterial PH domain